MVYVEESENPQLQHDQFIKDYNETSQNEETYSESAPKSSKIEKAQAQFIFYLRANAVPESKIKAVIKNTEMLVLCCVEEFSEEVEKQLREKGIELRKLINIEHATESSSKVFSKFQMKQQQVFYFKSNFCIVKPKRKELNTRVVWDRKAKFSENRDSKLHSDEFMYVSIIEVIQNLVSKEEYQKLLYPEDEGQLYSKK